MPQPRTAIVCPPAASAPRWAAVSIPRARPLTIWMPWAAMSRARDSAAMIPVGDGPARPDHGQGVGEAAPTPAIKQCRRIGDVFQQRRVIGIPVGEQPAVERRQPFEHREQVRVIGWRGSRGGCQAESGKCRPLARVAGEDRLRRAVMVDQPEQADPAQPRRQLQAQPTGVSVHNPPSIAGTTDSSTPRPHGAGRPRRQFNR